ncbi:MAG: hypothetical protein A2X42_11565 [Candidatus Margulisbacteria bacterium GWF2_38_17]|nr:MAG: hypothetical protein A2X42_11565 [Candidatus Margulisbacteria bacterium GWF2_38_17]
MNLSNATKVGIVTFLSVIILVVGLLWKSGLYIKAYGYRIYGNFETVSGLLLSSQVRYRGYLVGFVEKIEPQTRRIRVSLIIKRGVVLPASSRLRVSFDGLIGEKYMDILAEVPTDEVLKAGTVLPGYASRGLVDFVDIGTQNLEETKKMLETLRNIITSPEVEKSIKDTILRLDTITIRFDEILSSVSKFTSSEEVSGLKDSLSSISLFVNDLRKKLLNPEAVNDVHAILKNTDSAMKNIKEASDKINSIFGSVDGMMQEKGTTTDITGLLKDTRETIQSVNKLLSEPEVKTTIKKTNLALDKTNRILSTIENTEFVPYASYNNRTKNSNNFYDLGFDVKYADIYSTGIGLSNRSGKDKLDYLQQGIQLNQDIVGRVGIMRSLTGFGLDYKKYDSLQVSIDFPYEKGLNLDCRVKYSPFNKGVFEKLYLMLGQESVFRENSSFVFGIGF